MFDVWVRAFAWLQCPQVDLHTSSLPSPPSSANFPDQTFYQDESTLWSLWLSQSCYVSGKPLREHPLDSDHLCGIRSMKDILNSLAA